MFQLLRQYAASLRLTILKAACKVLLPKDTWIGKSLGAYTGEYRVTFGRLDSRGVLQGVTEKQITKRH